MTNFNLIHRSHTGAIKSAPDKIYLPSHNEGPLVNYWRMVYLEGREGSEKEMWKNREGRVVYFTVEGWHEWPYGDRHVAEVSAEQPCFAGLPGCGHYQTTVEEAEDMILNLDEDPEYLWGNLRFMEIIIPVEWLPEEITKSIHYEYWTE